MTKPTVALCHNSVKAKKAQFENITTGKLFELLKGVKVGSKYGSYFLRTSVIDGSKERSDKNTKNTASILILDCDSTVNIKTGEITVGAPCPRTVHKALKSAGINHLLHASHSHSIKGCRHGRV